MTFEEFLENAKNHAGDLFKAVADMCFDDIIEVTEGKLINGTEGKIMPTLLVVGMNPEAVRNNGGEKEVGLEISQEAYDFEEYNTPAQKRALRQIAEKVVVENERYPLAAFLLAEATSYQPNEEEMEQIRQANNPQEKMAEVAKKAKEEGRVMDICILAGMTFRKEMYFFTRLLDYDEQGNLVPLDEARYEELDIDFPLRMRQGGEGDEDHEIGLAEMNGNGIDMLYSFFRETQPLMRNRLENKLGIADEKQDEQSEDRDKNLAKTINERTALDWDSE